MRHLTRNTLLITSLGTLLAAGCSGGGGDDADPVNEGSYTTDDFDYQSPHGPDHQPLSGMVTAILGRKDIVALDPAGTYAAVGDFDHGSGDWTYTDGFVFEHAASGQIDSDPDEEFLAARFSPPAGGEPGFIEVASLERDGTWLVRFQLEVGAVVPRAFATGDVDGDARSEVIVVWDDPQGVWVSVVDDGVLFQEIPVLAGYNDLDLERLELELADLDADGRDEIVVLGNRGPYWEAPLEQHRRPALEVLDDASTAFQLLTQREVDNFGHPELLEGSASRLVAGDFDRYHEGAEICVTRHVYAHTANTATDMIFLQYESFALVGDPPALRRWDMGAEDENEVHLVLLDPEFGLGVVDPPTEGLANFDSVAADLDGDGSDELVSAWFTRGSGGSWGCPSGEGRFLIFNIVLDRPTEEIAERWSVPDSPPPLLVPDFPVEFNADGWNRAGSYALLHAPHAPVSSRSSTCSGWPDFEAEQWSLVASDQDADARDELHVVGADGDYHPVISNFLNLIEAEEQDAVFSLAQTWGCLISENLAPPRLLFADWDGDDFRVKYTGNNKLAVGNPLPLVLMGAPPTKAGVSQNYSGSQTVFETSLGTEKVYSVTNGISAGVWAGYEVSDPFGIFGASGKVKFEVELARTDTRATAVTLSENYSTAHDDDVIVFQGTLYESYEYEVVAAEDPSAIGEIMTIDVPVDTKVYKWTLDFYNASVTPEHVIGPEVLGHTIGDPASYMRKSDAMDLVADDSVHAPGEGYVGWMSDPRSLGQSGGSNGVTIEIAEQTSTATQVGWSVTAEQEFKAGSFVGGFSVGLTQDFVYEVSVSRTTRYHGEVGDISNWGEYQTWNYDFGLVAYTRGLFSDAANEPDGVETGLVPFQIETYYTAPVGSGY